MPNMTYQWERDDGDIAGANGTVAVSSPGEVAEKYIPVSGDTGHTVRLRASDGTNIFYSGWSTPVVALPTSSTGYSAGVYK